MLFAVTAGAFGLAIGPADFGETVDAGLLVTVITDCLLECFWLGFSGLFHVLDLVKLY
jgi:hypothetical protein